MQVMYRGLERHLGREHVGFLGRQVALTQIAGRAGRDHVDPGGLSAARPAPGETTYIGI